MTRTTDPYEELAAMFLTGDDAPGGDARRTSTTIELLVVGHLPVRAGLWLLPYVDQVARHNESAALLRLDGEAPWLKRLGVSRIALPRDPVTLREAIDTACRETAARVVRPALDDDWAELVRAGANRVTILSGANDAAVYKAYEIVKELAAAAESARVPLPEIGVAFMGVDEASAEDALRRINETSAEFIGVRIPMLACVPRIDAVAPPIFDRQFAHEACPGIADVVRWISVRSAEAAEEAQAPSPAASPPVAPVTPVAPVARPVVETPVDVHAEEWAMPAPARAAQAPVAPVHREGADVLGGRRGRTIKLRPKVRAELEPKQPAPTSEPSVDGRPVPLAAHVEGLTPLAARCPGHEHVELAVDKAGLLHLLGRETTLREMHYVAAWVRSHRELLALACPHQTIDPLERPVCHVFTSEPTEVADLHGADLCLHVMAPVRVGAQTGWYVAALNRP